MIGLVVVGGVGIGLVDVRGYSEIGYEHVQSARSMKGERRGACVRLSRELGFTCVYRGH